MTSQQLEEVCLELKPSYKILQMAELEGVFMSSHWYNLKMCINKNLSFSRTSSRNRFF